MKFNWFIGIDVSKKTLDITVLQGTTKVLYKEIANDSKQLILFIKELKSNNIELSQSLFCMEHTGIYCRPVIALSEKYSLHLWIENATQIKLSIGLQRGKNDKIDSFRIAEYASRNHDKACLSIPDRKVIKELKTLNLARTRLIATLKSMQTASQEQDYYEKKSDFKRYFIQSIKGLKEDLKKVEVLIDKVIKSDVRLQELFDIVKSVKGIGKVMAVNMIITTNEFKKISDHRKYACYAGVVPFEHSSGSSLRGKHRISKRANMKIKTLLHMAALSAIQSCQDIKEFYQRKLSEGKAKMVIINAVRNKLIQRVFACVRDNRKYENIYASTVV